MSIVRHNRAAHVVPMACCEIRTMSFPPPAPDNFGKAYSRRTRKSRSKIVVLIWSGVLLVPAIRASGQCTLHEDAKLSAADLAAERFGFSVSLSGDTAVVGANFTADDCPSGPNCNSGSAYVFVRTNGVWTQQAKLTASDAAAGDRFGVCVSVSGDTALIGALQDDHAGGTDAGSAYVFVRSGTVWTEQAKLTASDAVAYDWFGHSVSLSGDTAAVGASSGHPVPGPGAAYIFVRSGDVWTQQQKLTASDAAAADHFGFAVSTDGDAVVVTAHANDDACPADPDCQSGSAYVFVKPVGGWSSVPSPITEVAKLTASDAAAGDIFGESVSVNGDTVVVGAGRNDDACPANPACQSGSAYVFVRSGGVWTEQQKLTALDAAAVDYFGGSVSVIGDIAVVGAFQPPGEPSSGSGSGSGYVFVRSGEVWTQRQKLTASDGATGNQFGVSVSLSGETAVIGASFDADAGSSSGSAYVFDIGIVDCNGNGIPDECDIANCFGGPLCADCNVNGIPDECEPDCNNNGCPDGCDIAPGIAFSQAAPLHLENGVPYGVTSTARTLAGLQVPLDLNNDNHTDLAVWAGTNQSLTVFIGNGNGTFVAPAMIYPLEWTRAGCLVAGHFDDDAYTDIVVGYQADSGFTPRLSFFKNSGDGSGSLLPPTAIAIGMDCQDLVAGDFDGDGLLDIINTARVVGPSRIGALRNLGGGSFATSVDFLVPNQSYELAVGDFDGDSWADVAVTSYDYHRLHVFRNRGVGVFDSTLFEIPPVPYNAGQFPSQVTAANLDNDQHIDLVISNTGEAAADPGVVILWNNPSAPGTFLPARFYPGGPGSEHVAADLDNDGDRDVAVGMDGGPPFIFENLGNRDFLPARRCADVTPFTAPIAAGNFNEDGRADLAGNKGFGDVDILLNDFGPLSEDCNSNGIPDACDLDNCPPIDTTCGDCNGNLVPDGCEVFALQTLLPSPEMGSIGDDFSGRIAVSGDTLMVGATHDDTTATNAGAVYVYRSINGQWIFVQKLVAPDGQASDKFGEVALEGSTAIIGATEDDDAASNAGSAYVFQRTGLNTWTYSNKKLLAGDPLDGDDFGVSLELQGDTLVVGARMASAVPGGAGKVYVFQRNAGGANNWGQVAELTATDTISLDSLGGLVAIDGDTIVASAVRAIAGGQVDAGAVYVYVRPPGGWTNMTQTAKLTSLSPTNDDSFGSRIDVVGDTIIVGAYQRDSLGLTDSGAVYAFQRPISGWVDAAQNPIIVPVELEAGDQFGVDVALSGSTLAVGAQFDDGTVPNSNIGSVYIYQRDPMNPGLWNFERLIAQPELTPNQHFGVPIRLVGRMMFVGNNGLHTFRAPAYAFNLDAFPSTDCNANGIPDECEPDCNGNGVPDECDVAGYLTGYTIVDLGVPGGSLHSIASDMNDEGHIVGTGLSTPTGGDESPFYFGANGMEFLPLPAGAATAAPAHINNLDQIGGQFAPQTNQGNSVLWERAGLGAWSATKLFDPGEVIGPTNTYAISDSGRTVGRAQFLPGDPPRPFVWESGAVCAIATEGRGVDVNELGQLAIDNFGLQPFLFSLQPSPINPCDGTLAPISGLGNPNLDVTALNNLGQVTGYEYSNTQDVFPAFLWSPTAPNGSTGAATELLRLAGHVGAHPFDVADGTSLASTTVVGRSFLVETAPRAVLWHVGGATSANPRVRVFDLNDLISPGSDWELQTATAINQRGQIAGYGTRSGGTQTRAFRLTPANDCNGNSIPDECDVADCPPNDLSCTDCNNNQIPDGCEPDGDSDLIPDDCDNCPAVANANQINTDGDAEGDACDEDDDNDGVPDSNDPDPLDPNVCGDSDEDLCDDCTIGTDDFGPLRDNLPGNDGPDADADGACDAGDNCLLIANPDQMNSDSDTFGDACDNCPSVTNQDQLNSDSLPIGDSQGDVCDNCPLVINEDQFDFDTDARGDLCDNCPFNMNLDQLDSDSDGKGDVCDVESGGPFNRYISFVPGNDPQMFAFRVDKLDSGPLGGPAGSCWVDVPNAMRNAKCVSAPVFRLWPELVVHVGDCEIVPVASYEIVATLEGVVFSAPYAVSTIAQPTGKFWGDVVGVNDGTKWTPPNGFTNVNDIQAILAYIQGFAIVPAFQAVNLEAISSDDPCLNNLVNTADVLIAVKAAQGDAYPFTTDPASCPICP